ncbi:hypothetical protein V2O64_25200 (plasmid) [Verrucomicrobiaceae bacterium 227]
MRTKQHPGTQNFSKTARLDVLQQELPGRSAAQTRDSGVTELAGKVSRR